MSLKQHSHFATNGYMFPLFRQMIINHSYFQTWSALLAAAILNMHFQDGHRRVITTKSKLVRTQLCLLMKDSNRLYIRRFSTQGNNGNTDTGLLLENGMGSFVLNRGIAFVKFSSDVNTPLTIDICSIYVSGLIYLEYTALTTVAECHPGLLWIIAEGLGLWSEWHYTTREIGGWIHNDERVTRMIMYPYTNPRVG